MPTCDVDHVRYQVAPDSLRAVLTPRKVHTHTPFFDSSMVTGRAVRTPPPGFTLTTDQFTPGCTRTTNSGSKQAASTVSRVARQPGRMVSCSCLAMRGSRQVLDGWVGSYDSETNRAPRPQVNDNEGTMTGQTLVRQPSPMLAEGLLTFRKREPVDVGLAVRQWEDYVEAFHTAGWKTIEVDPVDGCPDGVFIEDTMVVYRNVAVISRPAHTSRRRELDAAEAAIASLGYSIKRIHAPGTLEGGDVLKVGRTIYVGRGSRTNAEAVRQLRSFLEPLGAHVVAVPITKVLHLKSGVTALPDGTIVGYTPLVDDPGRFLHYMGMPEESGAHVVDLGGGLVLTAADCPRSVEIIEDLGYEVIPVDVSEFQKLEGCVTCLSVQLRGSTD